MGPFEVGHIDPFKPFLPVSIKEFSRLLSSCFVYVRINPPALDNSLNIVIGLTMPNQVNFFALQVFLF